MHACGHVKPKSFQGMAFSDMFFSGFESRDLPRVRDIVCRHITKHGSVYNHTEMGPPAMSAWIAWLQTPSLSFSTGV